MGRTACTEPQCLYKGDIYLYLYAFFVFLHCFSLADIGSKNNNNYNNNKKE
jgi:hypothetical protein